MAQVDGHPIRDEYRIHPAIFQLERYLVLEMNDIVATLTAVRAPLFKAGWIRPGTHVASMGSDASGKQELPPALFDRASLFCDLPAQAVVLGDLQHFSGDATRITPIGRVLSGQAPGRKDDQDITGFESAGIALPIHGLETRARCCRMT